MKQISALKDSERILKKSGPFLVSKLIQITGLNVHSRLAGVPVHQDSFRWAPFYERPLIRGMEGIVEDGDVVAIVGGGRGVTTVKAAKNVGENGRVIVYECGEETLQILTNTVRLNGVEDRVEIHHAYVGAPETISDESKTVSVVSVDEIPEIDVLELDCEGSELSVLTQLRESDVRPRGITVETHGRLGVPRKDVRELLEAMNYEVRHVGIEYRPSDVHILVGRRRAERLSQ